MAADRPSRDGAQGRKRFQKGRQIDPPAGEAGAAFDQQTAGGGLADRAAEPDAVSRRCAVAVQPAAALVFLTEQRQRRGDAVRIARKIAAGEPQPEGPAGGEERGEEAFMIETRGCGEGQKGISGRGAHGREIGKVDGEQTPRDESGIESGWKMNAGDLMIDGDDERSARWQHRRVVTDQRRVEPPAQPIDQTVFAGERRASTHTVAGCGCSLAMSAGEPSGVTTGCRSSGSSSASLSTSSM